MGRALRAEIMKLKRSRVPLWSALVVLLWPIWSIGTMGFSGASIDELVWTELMHMNTQAIASWYGVILGGFVAAYVFGREAGEGTFRAMLTLPVRREAFVVSKLAVLLGWVFGLTALSVLTYVLYGSLLGIDGLTLSAIVDGLIDAGTIMLIVAATLPIVGFIAVLGRGYLAPMIFSSTVFISGAVALRVGWEQWYPWAMPYAKVGLAWLPGDTSSSLTTTSWVVLALTFVTGVVALIAHADYADDCC